MSQNDTTQILQQTDTVLKNCLHTVQSLLDSTDNAKFKILLIDSGETFKERSDALKEKLASLQCESPCPTTNLTQPEHSIPPVHSDRQIANILFDYCNESVKEIFTYLNHYKGIDQKVEKKVKDAVKAIERLREHLAEYL